MSTKQGPAETPDAPADAAPPCSRAAGIRHAADGGDGQAHAFERMHELMFLFRGRLQQALREDASGLTGLELRVLGYFGRQPGATQAELVQHSGRDKGQVARLVKGLEARGLLRREPGAGRGAGLMLTEAGAALHGRLEGLRARVAGRALQALDPDELIQLSRLLDKLNGALRHQ
ncbi:hypothetical protein GCM10023144_38560 [Pigmentiphaga soli]|uniref:HTH marR-type domain-containing protein n=1 Tax=Pigmentiphaga soli TaxID=1007095 RepID=A0ABP8HIZ4_9BURK